MKLRIVDTLTELDALEEPWNDLAARTSASYFSSFEYVRTAWSHLREPTARLLILVVSDGPTVVGIAPFCISRERRLGVPCRVIKFIAMWGGDRPHVLADGDVEQVWTSILTFLWDGHRAWEELDLREQLAEGPAGRGWSFLQRPGRRWERSADAVGYYIPLDGTWDDYLKKLSANTRGDWRRKTRRLRECGDYTVEHLSGPRDVAVGLERFIAVELSGWKAEAGAGVAKDDAHRRFYGDLLARLASRNDASVHLLRSQGVDVASLINFAHRDVVYMKHTVYSSEYAKFSPGVLLLGEVTRRLFGRGLREYDLLGMRDQGRQRYKVQWARGRRETVAWTGYRRSGRILPWLVARSVYKRLRSRAAPPSPAPGGRTSEGAGGS